VSAYAHALVKTSFYRLVFTRAEAQAQAQAQAQVKTATT